MLSEKNDLSHIFDTADATAKVVGGSFKNPFPLLPDSFKCLVLDIETGEHKDSEKFMPEFKEPRLKKDKTPYANSLTIAEQKEEWKSKTALSPLTAEILAIGLADFYGNIVVLGTLPLEHTEYGYTYLHCETEAEMLERMWKIYIQFTKKGATVVGSNIKQFDFPFMAFRSWVNKVEAKWNSYKDKWMSGFFDLCEVGAMSYRDKISLDMLSKALLNEGKIDDGKNFAKNFRDPTTRMRAVRYLLDDIKKNYNNYMRIAYNK